MRAKKPHFILFFKKGQSYEIFSLIVVIFSLIVVSSILSPPISFAMAAMSGVVQTTFNCACAVAATKVKISNSVTA